jgi:hypothetical protein
LRSRIVLACADGTPVSRVAAELGVARTTAGMSQSAVSRIWWAFGLRPHVVQTWKLSADPQFIDKVRDVVGLYMSPPENALVLCVNARLRPQRHHQPVRRP